MQSRVHQGVLLAVPFAVSAVASPPAEAVRDLGGVALDPTAPLVAAVALAAWSCSAWLVLVVALTLGSNLPGVLGRLAGIAAAGVAPAAVRHAIRVVVGVGVAATVLTGPAWAAEGPTPAPRAPAASVLSFDWPLTASPGPATTTAAPAMPAGAAAVPAGQVGTKTSAAGPKEVHHARTSVPAAGRGGPGASPTSHPRTTHPFADTTTVVVKPGDCLWDLAAAALGAGATDRQIAQAWPLWWSANRSVLGDNPDVLHPGTELHAPRTP